MRPRPDRRPAAGGNDRPRDRIPAPSPGPRSPLAVALAPHKLGTVLSLVVAPRAGVTALLRIEVDSLRVGVAAPPVAGAANDALVRFLAEVAAVPRSRVRIVAGKTSRQKRLLFAGLTPEELAPRLAAALPPSETAEKAPLSRDRERGAGG